MQIPLALGIDIGGTQTKLCIADQEGNILRQKIVPTQKTHLKDVIIQDVITHGKSLISDFERPISAIGVGFCGPVDHRQGVVLDSPIIEGWENVPLARIIQAKFDLPVFLENDASLAIYAEVANGVAKDMHTVIGFTVGTGIGGAIILNGNIYSGRHNWGSELGHMTVKPNGLHCPCGNYGCLTQEASTKSVVKRYEEITGNRIPIKEIFDRAKITDEDSLVAIMPMLDALAIGIGNVLNVFDPDCVVIAGGITNAGEWFLNKLENNIQSRVHPRLYSAVPVYLAELKDITGAFGAAMFALRQP